LKACPFDFPAYGQVLVANNPTQFLQRRDAFLVELPQHGDTFLADPT